MYADRLYSMILEQSENLDKLDNIIFIQINLNAVDKLDAKKEKLKYGTDRLVTYGVNSNKTYNNNKFVLVKYHEYYRDLYYNKRKKLEKADLWLVLLASRNFQKLYNVSHELLEKEMNYEFMRKVIDVIGNRRIFEDWKIKYLNRYVEYKKEQNAIKDCLERGLKKGLEQGVEQGIEECIKNMINENLDIKLISKITNKTETEILKINENLL